MMVGKILVVDDEKPIAEIIKYNLEKEGFQVVMAYDGEEALETAARVQPDAVILDIMLPKCDGYTVCRTLRRDSMVPILMLTARDDEVDKVLGLEIGADDYVTKPFSPRELVARIKALLRRAQVGSSGLPGAKTIRRGNLVLNPSTYECFKREKRVELSVREFELLRFLASNPGRVFSREMLLEEVWGYEFYGDIRTVDVTIRRLREKIEDHPSAPELILTKRGVGYYFTAGDHRPGD